MIALDIKQGSPEWHWARLGIPTASQFSRLLTAKTLKLSSGSEDYMHELLAEWLIGMPVGGAASGFMARGSEMEAWAVDYYEFQRDVTTSRVGFCLLDNRMAGCSPDRLVGDDGGLEIKCPGAKQHVANLLDMTSDHFAQTQGCLFVTGRKWWDILSYHPDLPSAIVRVERDETYIAALGSAIAQFIERLTAAREKLLALGCEPAVSLNPEFSASRRSNET